MAVGGLGAATDWPASPKDHELLARAGLLSVANTTPLFGTQSEAAVIRHEGIGSRAG